MAESSGRRAGDLVEAPFYEAELEKDYQGGFVWGVTVYAVNGAERQVVGGGRWFGTRSAALIAANRAVYEYEQEQYARLAPERETVRLPSPARTSD